MVQTEPEVDDILQKYFAEKIISDQLAVVHLKSETNSTAETSKTKL